MLIAYVPFIAAICQLRANHIQLCQSGLFFGSFFSSSGGLERVFRFMGFIHFDLRNKFDVQKVGKMLFCNIFFKLIGLEKNNV